MTVLQCDRIITISPLLVPPCAVGWDTCSYGTARGGWTAYLDQRAVADTVTTCDDATFGEPGGNGPRR